MYLLAESSKTFFTNHISICLNAPYVRDNSNILFTRIIPNEAVSKSISIPILFHWQLFLKNFPCINRYLGLVKGRGKKSAIPRALALRWNQNTS